MQKLYTKFQNYFFSFQTWTLIRAENLMSLCTKKLENVIFCACWWVWSCEQLKAPQPQKAGVCF